MQIDHREGCPGNRIERYPLKKPETYKAGGVYRIRYERVNVARCLDCAAATYTATDGRVLVRN